MLQIILDWSEVWATLIPLTFILSRKNIPVYLKPVRLYVWVALLLNTAATLLWWFKNPWGIEKGDFFWSNTFLYNTHSIIRLLLFSWFFILLKQRFMHRVKIILPLLFIAFIIIRLIFCKFYDRLRLFYFQT